MTACVGITDYRSSNLALRHDWSVLAALLRPRPFHVALCSKHLGLASPCKSCAFTRSFLWTGCSSHVGKYGETCFGDMNRLIAALIYTFHWWDALSWHCDSHRPELVWTWRVQYHYCVSRSSWNNSGLEELFDKFVFIVCWYHTLKEATGDTSSYSMLIYENEGGHWHNQHV